MPRRTITIVIIAVLLAIVSFLLGFRFPGYNVIFQGIGISVFSSVTFWLISDILHVSSEREALNAYITRLENLEKYKDIKDIRNNDDNLDSFWIHFADDAENKLEISGKTLDKWINTRKKQEIFKKAIIRIVRNNDKKVFGKNGEAVKLVLYSDKGLQALIERTNESIEKYLADKKSVMVFIYDVWRRLANENQRRNIGVYEVDALPYMYCSNGKQCVTGSYFYKRKDKKNLLLIHNCSKNSIEEEFSEDFYDMIALIEPTNISNWKPKA